MINATEAGQTIAITGTVGGDAKAGDTVTLTVNGKTFTGPVVDTAGTLGFSIDVPGADLVADSNSSIDASISTTDAAGNVGTGTDTEGYSVDTQAPTAAIDIVTISADTGVPGDFITRDNTLTVSGTVGALGAGEKAQISVDDGTTWVDLSVSNGNWNYVDGRTLSLGDHDYQVRVVDPAGNVGATDTQKVTITANHDPIAVNDPGTAGGLTGQYYAYHENTSTTTNDGGNLSSLSQVRAFIAANSPDAAFVANNINYTLSNGNLGGNNNLQSFLGSDAASLNGVDPENSSDAIIRLSGTLQLQAGSYQFQVLADDGYSILIDGIVVAQFDGNQSPSSSNGAFSISEPGSHTIEIIYWDQGGQAVLQPTLSFNGGAYESLINFSPAQANPALVTAEDTPLSISLATLLANDSDADGDTLSITTVGNASHGTATLNSNGTITFTPAANYFGPASFTYTISDGQGGSSTATVTLNITSVNDAPTISAGTAHVSEEGLTGGIADSSGISDLSNAKTISGQLTIQDPDSSTLSVTLSAPTTALTSGSQGITWAGAGTGLLIGYAGSATPANEAVRVSIDNSGNYTVTLSKPLNHGTANVEDILQLGVGVTVSDGALSTSTTLAVVIEDDMPSGAIVRTLEVPIDQIVIHNLQGGFESGVFVGGTSTVAYTNNDTDSKNDSVTWGTPTTTGGSKSGYSLVDNSALSSTVGQMIAAGSTFKMADFSHINMPIESGSSTLDRVTLSMTMQVTINGTAVTVPFTVLLDHTETPNDGADSRDIITLPAQDVIIELSGQTYSFRLEGFKDSSGAIVNTIYTNESATNTFGIYGSLNTTLAMPSMEGSVAGTAGADGFGSVTWGNLNNAYGTLTTTADGGYRFVLNKAGYDLMQTGGTVLAPTFNYTVTDKDGDAFNSTLTINLQADRDSSPVANNNFAQTTLISTPATSIADLSANDSRGDNASSNVSSEFTVGEGTGTLSFNSTRIGNSDDSFRYALEQKISGSWEVVSFDNASTLTDNIAISNLAANASYRIRLYVNDDSRRNGDASATLNNILLTTTLLTPVIAVAAGNIITDTDNYIGSTDAWGSVDSLGQEGALISMVNGQTVQSGGSSITGQYGTLLIAANGSYTYTPNTDLSNVGKSETFTYTLSQTDGDSDTANLIIKISDTAYVAPSPISGSGTLNGDAADNVIIGSSGVDTLTGNGGNDHLEGKAGNDTLYGNVGNDILIGGEGDDILFGGSQGDTFVWHAGDTGKDTIKDLTLSGADRDTIDLRDLLQGESVANIGDFVRVVSTNSVTSLEISSHGEFGHGAKADVTINLENSGAPVDLSGYGSTSSEIINSLIGNNLIKVDHS